MPARWIAMRGAARIIDINGTRPSRRPPAAAGRRRSGSRRNGRRAGRAARSRRRPRPPRERTARPRRCPAARWPARSSPFARAPRRSNSCAAPVAVRCRQAHVDVLAGAKVERLGQREEEALDARRALDDVDDRRPSASLAGRSRPTPASVGVIALLAPRISVHVIAAQLPEAGLVALGELQSVHPLRRLPEVEVRHQQARGAAVIGLERLACRSARRSSPCRRRDPRSARWSSSRRRSERA